MVEDIDIWRTAKLLLRQHGGDAPLIAAQRRNALLEAGETNGTIIGKCVMTATEELTRRRGAGEGAT
jgi:hypothetical protein